MADIRGPLRVSRREIHRAHYTPIPILLGTLLTTLLAPNVQALPIGKSALPLHVEAKTPGNYLNANTSAGMPKTLFADAQMPVGKQLPPDWKAKAGLEPNPDTSRGTPKTLTPDAQLPVGTQLPPQWKYESGRWLNPDTSRGTPKTLTADAQLPVGTQLPLDWKYESGRWLNPDTSQETAKGLIPDAQAPIGAQLGPEWQQNRRTILETSQGTPEGLLPVVVVALPPGQQSTLQPDRLRWLPDETSGTRLINPDSLQPVGANQDVAGLDPRITRLTPDTSRGYTALLPIPLPPGQASFVALQRFPWLPASTTTGVAKAAFADAQLPVQNPAQPGLNRRLTQPQTASGSTYLLVAPLDVLPPGQRSYVPVAWRHQPLRDVSRGTPKTLTADTQPPVFNLPHHSPQAKPIGRQMVVDTTKGLNTALRTFIPPPPPPAPLAQPGLKRFWFQPADTTHGLPKTLLPEPPPPPPPPPPGYPATGGWIELLFNTEDEFDLALEAERLQLEILRVPSKLIAMVAQEGGDETELKAQFKLAGIKWQDKYAAALEVYTALYEQLRMVRELAAKGINRHFDEDEG